MVVSSRDIRPNSVGLIAPACPYGEARCGNVPSGRRCRVEPLKQSAAGIVGAERAKRRFGNFELRSTVPVSSDKEELEIESERGGSVVDGRFETAAVG
jgi:hypothetical protein